MRIKSIIPIAATCLVLFIGSCTKDTTPSSDPKMNTATDLLDANAAVTANTNKSLSTSSTYTPGDKLTSPLNNATGVSLDQIITVSFNDNLTPLQISRSTFTLKAMTSGSSMDDSHKSMNDGSYGVTVAGTVSFNNKTAIFTPTSKLSPNTIYVATITSRYFGQSGDDRPKLGYSWHFTTGAGVSTTIPTITSSLPLNAATGVVLNQPVSVNFSEAMDPLTINATTFTVKQGTLAIAGTVSYSGTKATFTPTSDFAPNTMYTVTVSTGAKDVSGIAMLSNYTFTFTTAAALDVIAPTVISADPLNGTTGVALTKAIAINFSESVLASTINATNITLKLGTTAVTGTVALSGTKATFTPSASLVANSVYTCTVSTGVKDLAGNALASNYTFSFTTGAAADVTPPTVTLVDPTNNATGVAINKALTITFSEAMDYATITSSTITLKQGTTAVAGTVAYAASKATFTPSANLVNGAVYTATITTGVHDAAGNAMASNYTFSFTTAAAADVTPPTVTLVDPANNTTGVAINKALTVTFSEAMNASSISTATITLKQGTTAVAGTVAYAASKATFTPSANLVNGVVYTATVTTGVQDVAGNAMASNYTFSFTTVAAADVTPPTVVSTDPLSGATAIATNKVIGITFSEAMMASSISTATFTLKQGTTAVAGTVAYSGTVGTFTPSSALVAGTVYTATLSTGAKDLAGNALAAAKTWSFTTAGTAPAPGLSFATDVMPVLAKCEACHTHGWTPSTVASTYYTNLVNSGYVVPASYTTSKIYSGINNGHYGTGITKVDSDKIITWMTQGSNNN